MVAAYSRMECQLLSGTVAYAPQNKSLGRLPALDAAWMMALTDVGVNSGRYFLGNGSHLACYKSPCDQTGGYSSHANTLSGDDELLVQKLRALTPIGRMW
jgi:hypothetical protein